MQIVSAASMRERVGDGLFWKRFAIACMVGYFFAIFGFSLVFGLLGFLQNTIERPPENVFWGIAGLVLVVPHIVVMSFLVGISMGAIPTLAMLPVALISALALRTRKAGTIIAGAVLGVLPGAPIIVGSFRALVQPLGVTLTLCCAGAGAMFALAVWKFCLRHYNAAGEKPVPGRFRLWWRARSLATKLAMACATVVFIALFGL